MKIKDIDRRLGKFNQRQRPYRAHYERPFRGRGGGANLIILVVVGESVARSSFIQTMRLTPEALDERLGILKLMAERPEETPSEEGEAVFASE